MSIIHLKKIFFHIPGNSFSNIGFFNSDFVIIQINKHKCINYLFLALLAIGHVSFCHG